MTPTGAFVVTFVLLLIPLINSTLMLLIKKRNLMNKVILSDNHLCYETMADGKHFLFWMSGSLTVAILALISLLSTYRQQLCLMPLLFAFDVFILSMVIYITSVISENPGESNNSSSSKLQVNKVNPVHPSLIGMKIRDVTNELKFLVR